MTRPSPTAVRWAMLLLLLVLWEVTPRFRLIPELFLPPLSKTLSVLVTDWHIYLAALGVTRVLVDSRNMQPAALALVPDFSELKLMATDDNLRIYELKR